MKLLKERIITFTLVLVSLGLTKAYCQEIYPQDADKYTQPIPGEQAIGRWDITVTLPIGTDASWLEIVKSGNSALVGRFVGQGGSARPISEIHFSPTTKTYSFTIPPQWGSENLRLTFKLQGGELKGWMDHPNNVNSQKLFWTAVRSPELKRTKESKWGNPVYLLKDGLSSWDVSKNSGWSFNDGILTHQEHGTNIMTKQKFEDFKLYMEFRYSKHSNSGIYLRGRYEVQVLDSYGAHTESHQLGGIYGFITPTINAAKKPYVWQTYNITLVGRMVTVVLNGKKIICNRPIPGITGGAINSNEGEPGPIMLQGSENGRIEYRKIILTPSE